MSETKPPSNGRIANLCPASVSQLCKKLRATVFVTACVILLHGHTDWVNTIDRHAYAIAGHDAFTRAYDAEAAAFQRAAAEPSETTVLVVRIDEYSFHKRYLERSPLNRCALLGQLKAIYEAKPTLLVIDIDLSPARGDKGDAGTGALRDCEAKLYAELDERAAAGIETVLMEPFPVSDHVLIADNKAWMASREKHGVRFGNAALPVRGGLVTEYFTGPGTLYGAATNSGIEGDKHRLNIDAFSKKLLPILTSWTEKRQSKNGNPSYNDADLTATLIRNWPGHTANEHQQRVVFFGGGYGEGDLYVTPAGPFYGVEIHAAAFASTGHPEWWHRLIELVVEIIFAFGCGMFCSWLWGIYYRKRMSADPGDSEGAPFYLALMLAGLVLVLALTIYAASFFLDQGLWLSPVPLAIGMLIEGGIYGSMETAEQRMRNPHGNVDDPEARAEESRWRLPATGWGAFCQFTWLAVVCLGLMHKFAE